jgi:hypothetical protein
MADTKTQNRPAAPQTDAPASNGNGTAARTPAPTFDAAFLNAPVITADNKIIKEAAQPKNKRSEAQIALDGVTPQIHQAWVQAGKPAAFAKLPTVSYPVKPEGVTKLKGMIRKAADFNGTRPRFGSDVTITPEIVASSPKLNDSHVGLVLVTFGVMDKSAGAKSDAQK